MNTIKVSVIIAIYKDIESLELILNSLLNQTYQGNYEIIVAEDGQDPTVAKFMESFKKQGVLHTTQEDQGWRKNKSLNNGINHAAGELLIFLDGDCIPYHNLIENYVKHVEKKTVLCGRRVELGETFSKLLREKKLTSSLLEKDYMKMYFQLMKDNTRHYEEGISFNNFFYKLKYRNKSSSIIGCNFGVNREDILAVNGFDENYLWPSVGEDTDLEYRLNLIGCKMKPVRNQANVFHLYHRNSYSQENNTFAMQYFETIKKQNLAKASNGLVKTH